MQFPQSYFEDEVREGFYIPSMVKCAWAAQLEVLEDITKVCVKYEIPYFAVSGTLLGAVRHGGFIPWDDDTDICMLRPDYDRFMDAARKELPHWYSVLEMNYEAKWDEMFARVVNGRGICLKQSFLEKFHGFPFVAGVDIFPLDYLAPNEEEMRQVCSLANPVMMCAKAAEEDFSYMSKEEIEEQLCVIEDLCRVKIDRNKSIKNQLFRLATTLCKLYREQESEKIGMTPDWMEKPSMRWPKAYYDEVVFLPFEVTGIAVPIAYDDVLRGIYGEYMRIVYDGGLHDYPFFRGQEEVLYEQNNLFPKRYRYHIEDFGGENGNIADTLMQLKNRVSDQKKERNTDRKEVVFLPYKASAWDALESVWRAAVEDPNCDVYVIPIPYYDKDWDGMAKARHYEADAFPDYVPVTEYEQFHPEEHHPDRIYIQFPHDEYHYTVSVDPAFYARKLINYTDCLIYIPYFVVDEIESWNEKALYNAKAFINVPGVLYADKVIVQSENMRQVYIDTLAEFAGEDTRKIWEDKISGAGSPLADCVQEDTKAGMVLPDAWQEKIQKPDGSYRKVILYYNNMSTLLQYQEQMIEKLQDTFRIFREKQEEVVLLWRPNPFIEESISWTHPQLWEKYKEVVDRFREENFGIYDDMAESDLAVTVCDAYYGDASYEMNLCRREGKPVMWQNVSIINSVE